ncbi:MAG: hypothetical protein ACTSVE_04140 [Candidatus Helarchaeota archaeon]
MNKLYLPSFTTPVFTFNSLKIIVFIKFNAIDFILQTHNVQTLNYLNVNISQVVPDSFWLILFLLSPGLSTLSHSFALTSPWPSPNSSSNSVNASQTTPPSKMPGNIPSHGLVCASLSSDN